ncbi:oligosaccharide flippase family protein [bacterium]|nr:oligosaccharide flippase family protein [bacterium]
MQRKFLSGLALMLILNLLIKPMAIFGIDAEIQNRVGSEQYGIYFSLLSFSFLFNILLDFGISNYTTKHVAQYPKVAVSYLGKILVLRGVLFVFYAVVSYSIAFILGWGKFEIYLLSFMVLNQLLVSLIAFTRSYFNGMLMFKTEAFLSVLDRLLLIVFCGALLYLPITGGEFQIEWFVWIQTICYSLSFVVALSLLLRKIGIPKFSFQRNFSIALIRKSIPYALLVLLMMIYTRVDSVMIERLHYNGGMEAGFYAQGFRLFDALFNFAIIFTGLLYPIFSQQLIKKIDFRPVLAFATKLLLGGTVALGIIAYFNAEIILSSIYDNDVLSSVVPFQFLMLGFVGMTANLLFGTLLTANGSLKFLNWVSAIGILLNISLNTFLIPEYGASGAAFATLITQGSVSTIQIIYSISYFSLKLTLLPILQFLGYLVAVWALCYFVRIDSIWMFLAVSGGSFVGMFVFGLIDFKQLKSIVASKGKEEITEG